MLHSESFSQAGLIMTYLLLLEAEYPFALLGIAMLFGLLIGSFLNVVVHRLPIMMERDWQTQARDILDLPQPESQETYNLSTPRSRCPNCQHKISAWENIPVISYLFLKGKCNGCQISISARYPSVELITAVMTAAVIYKFGPSLTGLAACLLTWALIALALIDFDTKFLPDSITLPFLWLGLIVNTVGLITVFPNAFWGAIVGYLSLWFIYQTFKLVTGKEGMGFGDFKLLALLGAWLGWQMLPLVIILSSFAGAVIGGTLIALGRDRANAIPFGPFLAIAGWLALMFGETITTQYLQFVAA